MDVHALGQEHLDNRVVASFCRAVERCFPVPRLEGEVGAPAQKHLDNRVVAVGCSVMWSGV